MAKERLDVDVILTQSQDLKTLAQTLLSSSKNADQLAQNFTRALRELKALSKETLKMQQALANATGGRSVGQTAQLIGGGGPSAQLVNAKITGAIRQFEATVEQTFARLNNRIMKGMTDVTRAVDAQMIQNLSRTRQLQAAGTLPALEQQIKAQQYRVSQAQLGVADPNRFFSDGRTTPQAALAKEQQALDKLLASRKQITDEISRQEMVERRIVTLTDRIAANVSKYRVARELPGTGPTALIDNQIQRVGVLVDTQRLRVEKERLMANGQMTQSLASQEVRLTALLQKEKELKLQKQDQLRISRQLSESQKVQTAAAAIQARAQDKNYMQATRDFSVERVLGDGGASLFKIQSALLVNYTLMSQLFNLFQFGSQFVLELDKAFRELQAITATTNTEMVKLKASIIDASTATKFTAVEVAQAATIMGQAGFSSKQIQDSIKDVTLFATAVGEDLGKAVDLATSVISIFNMRAEEMGHVANVLTGAINLTKLTVDKLSLGLQYAGNAAAQSGATLEETVAILGALANAGIRSGSTLGTGVRQLITELESPSKKLVKQLSNVGLSVEDVNIKSRGLVTVFRTLRDAGFNAGAAFESFEVRSAAAYIAIANNIDVAENLERQLLLTNAAAEANDTQMKSLANTFDKFRSILGTTIADGFEPLKNSLIVMVQGLGFVVQALGDMKIVLPVIGAGLTGLGLAIAGLKLAQLIKNLNLFTFGMRAAGATAATSALSFRLLGSAITVSLGPISILATVLTSVILASGGFANSMSKNKEKLDQMRASVDEAAGNLESTKSRIESVSGEIDRLTKRYAELTSNSSSLQTEVLAMQLKFGEFSDELASGAITTVKDLIGALRDLRAEFKAASAEEAALLFNQQALMLREQLRQSSDRVKQFNRPISYFSDEDSSFTRFNRNPFYRTNAVNAQGIDKFGSYEAQIKQINQVALDPNNTQQLNKVFENLTKLRGDLIIESNKLTTEIKRLSDEQQRKGSTANSEMIKSLSTTNQAYLDLIGNINASQQTTTNLIQSAQTRLKFLGENSETAKKLNETAEDVKIKISQTEEQLRGKIKPEERASLEAQLKAYREQLQKILVDQVPAAAQEILDKAKGVYNGDTSDKGAQATVISETQQTLTSTMTEAGQAAEHYADSTSAFFDKVAEQQKMAIERAQRAADAATDRFDREINRMKFTLEQARDLRRGGLRGRYSDAELSMIEDKIYSTETERLRTRASELRTNLLPAMDQSIGRLQGAVDGQGNLKKRIEAERELNRALDEKRKIENELTDIESEIAARTGEITEAHRSFGEQLTYVLQKYAEQKRLQTDFALNMERDITQILDDAGDAMQQFVTDTVTGTKSVKEAFRDMATSILSSMLKIATNQLASSLMGKLFGTLLGGVSSGTTYDASGTAIGGWTSQTVPIGPSTIMRRGGMVRAARGMGIVGRDSVPALLEPGEYVMRKQSVDYIGRQALDMMNAFGARKISQAAGDYGPQENGGPTVLNVYVVGPDQKPSLSKNDVLVTVQDDLMKNGGTAKLVKQIVVGR